MEQIQKLVRVYSNNSKKSRLKRKHNKFQRVWNDEKQTYIKVRKISNGLKRLSKKEIKKMFSEKPKNVPTSTLNAKVLKPKTKDAHPAKSPIRKVNITINNMAYTWDQKRLMYRKAA